DTVKSETNFGEKYLWFRFSYSEISRDGPSISTDKLGIKICRTATYIIVMNDGVLRALLINWLSLKMASV
uniref:hypothetical protein n=1 Tax=Parasutterella excrementihominis TaxID=487175 RepID=UPI00265EFB81